LDYTFEQAENNTDSRPYKVYTSILTQNSTNPPSATVLENTLDLQPTFLYESTGIYKILYNEDLPLAKTTIFISNNTNIDSSEPSVVEILVVSQNEVWIRSSNAMGVNQNNILRFTSIEIRVYE
jgi:hypothetical protein